MIVMVVPFVPRLLCLLILRLCYFKWTEFPIYNEYYELSMDGGVFSDEIHLAYFYLMRSRSDFISLIITRGLRTVFCCWRVMWH